MTEDLTKALEAGIREMSDEQLTNKLKEMENHIQKHSFGGMEISYIESLKEEINYRDDIANCPHKNTESGRWGKICIDCGIKL